MSTRKQAPGNKHIERTQDRQEVKQSGKVDRLPIFLRAHTVKVKKQHKDSSDPDKALPAPWPDYALIFDTETRTTVDQTLMFGIYRVCRLVAGHYRCQREGIVYDPRLSKEELNTIGSFVLNTIPDVEVPQFPPKSRLEPHQSFPEFMEHVFFPALRRGWLIAGFNLPFDLSRLSLDWRSTRNRGFALILSKTWWKKIRRWVANPYRPPINVEAKDARTAFISRGSTKRPTEWPNDARPLDIGTLLFALFDQHRSLRDWCRYFCEERKLEWVHEKLDHQPSGHVTLDELQYCRGDVQCTQDLLNCAKAEFDLYALDDLFPDKVYSPASIGKAIFRQMGIIPPSKKFAIPPELQGVFMQTYFGGRAECHIRKVRVPIVRLDFLSQYPTVNTLMGNWEILTAESVSFPDVTSEVREFAKVVTLGTF